MICKKCGKNIPDESTFCSHCGCDLRMSTPSLNRQPKEEQIPLLLLAKQIVKHKVAVIISIVVVASCFVGYHFYDKYQKKKTAETEIKRELNHFMNIVGSYENRDKELILSFDNTATLTVNRDRYNERTYRGYWKEKVEGNPIEIEFSSSFEGYIGSKHRYAISTLYLYNGRLWESMNAIRSDDYEASESVNKKY